MHAVLCAMARYNDRVARNEGRILGFVNEARGSRITGYTRSMKRMVEKASTPGSPTLHNAASALPGAVMCPTVRITC